MSLAVAITNTGAVFSESQVRNVPKTRAAVPPSLPAEPCVPANALSISSIQRIAGATLSAVWIARRMFSSLDPTRLPNIRPMSNRSSGSFHRLEAAFGAQALAATLHAQQQDPSGAGRPNCAARSLNAGAPLLEPVLEVLQPGDVGELLLALVVLQQAALADDLLLLAEDDADVVGVELAVDDEGLGEDVLRLLERQPARGVDQPLAALGVEVDGDPAACP